MLEIVGRERALKKRTGRTQPLPRKKRGITIAFRSNPIGNSLRRILRAFQAQKNISQIIEKENNLLAGKTKPRSRNIYIFSCDITSRGDYITLLVDVEIVDNIEIRNDFRYIEITIVVLICLKRNGSRNRLRILFSEEPTNRKTKVIGKRIRLNHNHSKSLKGRTKSLFDLGRNKQLIVLRTKTKVKGRIGWKVRFQRRKNNLRGVLSNSILIEEKTRIVKTIRSKEILEAQLVTVNKRSLHRHRLDKGRRTEVEDIASSHIEHSNRSDRSHRKVSNLHMRKINIGTAILTPRQKH